MAVDLRTLRDGFTLAHNRFEGETQAKAPRDAADAFFPLFEALNWAVAFSDRMEHEWPGTSAQHHWFNDFPDSPHGPSAETMLAMRFVRNRVHHSWAEALQCVPRTPVEGHWDQRTFEWRWRQTADIPGAGAGTREGEAEYDGWLKAASRFETRSAGSKRSSAWPYKRSASGSTARSTRTRGRAGAGRYSSRSGVASASTRCDSAVGSRATLGHDRDLQRRDRHGRPKWDLEEGQLMRLSPVV
jgi:hypothetical protein